MTREQRLSYWLNNPPSMMGYLIPVCDHCKGQLSIDESKCLECGRETGNAELVERLAKEFALREQGSGI